MTPISLSAAALLVQSWDKQGRHGRSYPATSKLINSPGLSTPLSGVGSRERGPHNMLAHGFQNPYFYFQSYTLMRDRTVACSEKAERLNIRWVSSLHQTDQRDPERVSFVIFKCRSSEENKWTFMGCFSSASLCFLFVCKKSVRQMDHHLAQNQMREYKTLFLGVEVEGRAPGNEGSSCALSQLSRLPTAWAGSPPCEGRSLPWPECVISAGWISHPSLLELVQTFHIDSLGGRVRARHPG